MPLGESNPDITFMSKEICVNGVGSIVNESIAGNKGIFKEVKLFSMIELMRLNPLISIVMFSPSIVILPWSIVTFEASGKLMSSRLSLIISVRLKSMKSVTLKSSGISTPSSESMKKSVKFVELSRSYRV